MTKLGIIAGSGLLPITLAEAYKNSGGEVIIAALETYANSADFDNYKCEIFKLGKVGAMLKYFKSYDVTKLIIVGSVKRPNLSTLYVDLKGTILLGKVMAAKLLGDDALLKIVANFIEGEGFVIESPLKYIKNTTNSETKIRPGKKDLEDIEYGKKIVLELGKLDIGQSVIIEDGYVLGVEAGEGTDGLIERCRNLRKADKKSVLVKMSKPNQDERLDIPTIGVETIANASKANMAGIAIEKDRVIILEPQKVIETADKLGLFLCFV